jgi:hypothetical protein
VRQDWLIGCPVYRAQAHCAHARAGPRTQGRPMKLSSPRGHERTEGALFP